MLLLVLLLALGAGVLVAGLTLTVRAGMAGVEAEVTGRQGLAAADRALAELARDAWASWAPARLRLSGGWAGELSDVPGETGAVLSALVVPVGAATEAGSTPPWGYSVEALLELGHDGLDLPRAALVAGSVMMPPDRILPIVQGEPGVEAAADVHTRTLLDPALLGPGIALAGLDQSWCLDPSTLALAAAESERPGSGIVALTEPNVGWHRLPVASPGSGPEDPILVVAAGGAGLDLRDLGDVYGVVVVDGAGLRLDGTRLHGTAVATEEVDVGIAGQVLWSSSLYRWATDRSIRRVRLVPGSRAETLYP